MKNKKFLKYKNGKEGVQKNNAEEYPFVTNPHAFFMV